VEVAVEVAVAMPVPPVCEFVCEFVFVAEAVLPVPGAPVRPGAPA
jgi:hypothetical protein